MPALPALGACMSKPISCPLCHGTLTKILVTVKNMRRGRHFVQRRRRYRCADADADADATAAADADADADARLKTKKACADIIRKHIPWSLISAGAAKLPAA